MVYPDVAQQVMLAVDGWSEFADAAGLSETLTQRIGSDLALHAPLTA
jgi:hypothetical protein